MREWRERRNLTLKDLGKRLGTSWQNVQRHETEDRLKVRDLPKYAAALEVETVDLVNSRFAPRIERERQIIEIMRQLSQEDAERLIQIGRALVDHATDKQEQPVAPASSQRRHS